MMLSSLSPLLRALCVLLQTTNELLRGTYKRRPNPFQKGCCSNFGVLVCPSLTKRCALGSCGLVLSRLVVVVVVAVVKMTAMSRQHIHASVDLNLHMHPVLTSINHPLLPVVYPLGGIFVPRVGNWRHILLLHCTACFSTF